LVQFKGLKINECVFYIIFYSSVTNYVNNYFPDADAYKIKCQNKLSILLRYHVHNSCYCKAFSLMANVSPDGESIEVCTRYMGTKEISGIAVIEMELLAILKRIKGNAFIKEVLILLSKL